MRFLKFGSQLEYLQFGGYQLKKGEITFLARFQLYSKVSGANNYLIIFLSIILNSFYSRYHYKLCIVLYVPLILNAN